VNADMTRLSEGTKAFWRPPTGEPGSAGSGDTGAGRFSRRALLGPGLGILAALLWLLGLHPVAPAQLGSLGLITALSPALLLSYVVLLTAVVAELMRRRPRPKLLTAFTTLGVVLVYGLQPASEQTARLSVSWLHAGFAQYIADNGHALQGYDARFSWPGFFALIGFLTKASGQPDATPLLQWAPVVLAGLGTLGMRALAVVVLGPGRPAWLATWLFLLAQWTEQDYFSPQSTTFVIMLAAVAVTARYLTRPPLAASGRAGPRRRLPPVNRPRDRLIAETLVVLFALALAPSHQLTPYVLGGLLLLMVFTGRLWPGWLPWLVLVPALVWFSLGAKDFWQGRLSMVIGDIGNISSSLDQGISGRFVGDADRTTILLIRVGITGAIGILGLIGWWIRRRRGSRSWALPLLALAPFGLVALQSYGGEVFVRCYLFALPFAAILGATALESLLGTPPAPGAMRATSLSRRVSARSPRRTARARAALVCAVLAIVALATITARGGNDAYTSFSRSDLAAMRTAYLLARPGQTISGLTSEALPFGYGEIGVVEQTSIESTCAGFKDVTECVLAAAPTYFIVTPTQQNYGQIFYGQRPGWAGRLVADLVASGAYRVVFDQGGSQVLQQTING
jgi:hypothetical protein